MNEAVKAEELEYVGFWLRVWASIIDTILVMFIVWPVMIWWYGPALESMTGFDLMYGASYWMINVVLPAVAVVLFWIYRQATPGKMAIGARIVDARTGGKPTTGQLVGRYFGYYLSTIPLFLGLIWVGIDERKQGWHDMLAGTVVVRPRNRGTRPVSFG